MTTPSFSLEGRRAIVTGASRGIGAGCAKALAQAGAEVACVGRSMKDLGPIVDDIRENGGRAVALQCDITDIDTAGAVIEAAGPFHVLVNNAGIARHSPLLDVTQESFDEVVGLNLRATFFMTQVVVRGMKKAGVAGSVITISSQMGHVGGPDRAVYSATKHAVEGMTKSAAIEFGPSGIRFNTVCPTFVRTALSGATLEDPDRMSWIASKIKLGRLADVEDIVGAVVFLAGDASAMITGTSILIDGGWTAG